jgi:hypothetical protein
LVEVLLFADRDHVNHQKGNGNVANEMKERFENDFCLGIIDEDREELEYLDEFSLLIETKYLKLWKHNSKDQYIIQVRPVIEKWIMSLCEENGISLKEFNLPENWRDLTKVSKSISSKKDQRFIRLFKEMKKKKIETILQLQGWIEYLKENKYNADINQLKNG